MLSSPAVSRSSYELLTALVRLGLAAEESSGELRRVVREQGSNETFGRVPSGGRTDKCSEFFDRLRIEVSCDSWKVGNQASTRRVSISRSVHPDALSAAIHAREPHVGGNRRSRCSSFWLRQRLDFHDRGGHSERRYVIVPDRDPESSRHEVQNRHRGMKLLK